MKHIKQFEHINNFYQEIHWKIYHANEMFEEFGEYYYEISYSKYREIYELSSSLDFSSKDRSFILSFVKEKDIDWYYDVNKKIIELYLPFEINESESDVTITISKRKDEWYYVSYEPDYNRSMVKYYKVDQFEGLIKFLKDVV